MQTQGSGGNYASLKDVRSKDSAGISETFRYDKNVIIKI